MQTVSIASALKTAISQLSNVCTNPKLDAEILLAFALQSDRSLLYARPEKLLATEISCLFFSLVQRRRAREPIAYITGVKEFWSLPLDVNSSVLIPRPETEMIVEAILQKFPQQKEMLIADLGTGSGAIAIALASERPSWHIYATDNCPHALQVAKNNAAKFAIKNIHFSKGDWCAALPSLSFDVIVSNPPYIAHSEWSHYAADLAYEPVQALRASENGLAAFRRITTQANAFLKPQGLLVFEHGFAQVADLQIIFLEAGFQVSTTILDLAGHPRVTIGIAQNL